jgi:hypothetical protein
MGAESIREVISVRREAQVNSREGEREMAGLAFE